MRIASLRPAQRRAARLITATLLALAWPLPASSQSTPRPSLSERERAIHLLNRATYGARPQDVDEVLRLGIDRWLARQLEPGSIVATRVSAPSAATLETLATRMRVEEPEMPAPPSAAHRGNMVELERLVVVVNASTGNPPVAPVALKLERSIWTARQLEEVMTDFWFNHFNVHHDKAQVRSALADYEDSAIRPYVFRRFDDMLVATARHPAMLMYLDNYVSRVPAVDSPLTSGGVNENYARELLELHTLGVDGGYTQQDVIEVARAFTGWGIPMRPRGGDLPPAIPTGHIPFEFRLSWHDMGEKVVLGQTLPAGRSIHDGLEVLHMLARHPSTARNIATKLVRHFVADDPPPTQVEALTEVFLSTDGDLREVTRALFTSAEFYAPAHYRAEVKRPFEFVVSAHRVTASGLSLGGRDLEAQRNGLVRQLQAFHHLPYAEPAPTGYPITADDWVSAGAMLGRMRFAVDMLAGTIPGVALHPTLGFDELVTSDARPTEVSDELQYRAGLSALTRKVLERVLQGSASARLHELIVEDLAQQTRANHATLLARAVALAIGSPEFQRY